MATSSNNVQQRLNKEMLLLQARMQSAEKIMLEKYRVKLLTLEARGSDESKISEYLKSDAGKIEWAAMNKEIKKMATGTISRIADVGFMAGFSK